MPVALGSAKKLGSSLRRRLSRKSGAAEQHDSKQTEEEPVVVQEEAKEDTKAPRMKLSERVSSFKDIFEHVAVEETKEPERGIKRQHSSPKGALILERVGSFKECVEAEAAAAEAQRKTDEWLKEHSHAKNALPGHEKIVTRLGRQLSFGRKTKKGDEQKACAEVVVESTPSFSDLMSKMHAIESGA